MALTDNLVAYYSFNENSGVVVGDSLGVSPGTWQGATGSQWGVGKIGAAGNFNGGNNAIDVGNTANVALTGDFSMSFWANQGTTMGGAVDIIRKESSNNGYGIETNGVSTYNYTAGWKNGGVVSGFNATIFTLSQNAWVHVVLTKSSTTLIAYTNGVASGTITGGGATIGTSTAVLTLGNFDPGAGNGFPGLLDEMGFWSRPLTQGEVTSIYNSGAGLAYPFTVASSSGRRRRGIGT